MIEKTINNLKNLSNQCSEIENKKKSILEQMKDIKNSVILSKEQEELLKNINTSLKIVADNKHFIESKLCEYFNAITKRVWASIVDTELAFNSTGIINDITYYKISFGTHYLGKRTGKNYSVKQLKFTDLYMIMSNTVFDKIIEFLTIKNKHIIVDALKQYKTYFLKYYYNDMLFFSDIREKYNIEIYNIDCEAYRDESIWVNKYTNFKIDSSDIEEIELNDETHSYNSRLKINKRTSTITIIQLFEQNFYDMLNNKLTTLINNIPEQKENIKKLEEELYGFILRNEL